MTRKPAAKISQPAPPADFDDAMRRMVGIPAPRAREIVQRTGPGKPKAEREGRKRELTPKATRRSG